MVYHIPNLKLPSLLNTRMHWTKMVQLKKEQRKATLYAITGNMTLPKWYRFPIHPPLIVVIMRMGPRKLDDDNLQGACKYVRDQIADIVGVDDGSDLYTWEYTQHIGPYGVLISITPYQQ